MSGLTQASDRRDPLECPICQKRFATKQCKNNHVLVIHQNAGRFKCSHCDRTFQVRTTMEIHERIHTGERPFHCKICPKGFKSKCDFRHHHLDMHAEKKFKCKTCGKGFGRKVALRRHLVVHSNKTFRCELCPNRFASKDLLQRHHTNYHAKKKFKCETCDKGFGIEYRLKEHLQCHSSERFECSLCGDSFQHSSGLGRHQKRLHSVTQHSETPGRRRPTRVEDPEEHGVAVPRPSGSGGLGSSTYSLRSRGKTPNYRDDDHDVEFNESSGSRSSGCSESRGPLRDDKEPSEPGQTRDGDVPEKEQNGRTENHRNMSASPYASRGRGQEASPIIVLSSDEEENESDEDADLATETSTFSNSSLKLVYDVEYRAPE